LHARVGTTKSAANLELLAVRSFAAAALVALTLTAPAMAQDTPYPDFDHRGKSTTLHGQGGLSCGKFLADREPLALGNGGHAQQMAWLLGYLYGIDAWNPYTVRTYDYNGLDAWLVEYCRTHPLDQLVNAGLKFYVYIGGRAPMNGTDYSAWRHFPGYKGQ
jgi:hypothetical protein